MKKINLVNGIRTYKNNGQHAEQMFRLTLTGEYVKADNKPFTMGGDCGIYQVKSARATICKGTDLDSHIAQDGAEMYAYVTADFSTAYIMNPAEYKDFVKGFGTVTKDSAKNGGAEKLRLGHETRAMRDYLAARLA
jgi:hypothetical protein